jgi:UDP-2,3-diacylglucosamine hydrolase
MSTLFISDLHLCDERLAITALFESFLKEITGHAEALYILGDLFEVWIGDDAALQDYQTVIQALRRTVKKGTPIYVMHGNRDFLLGPRFEQVSGCNLIPDPMVINLYGTRTLLTHGDLLCTDDHEYQAYRAQIRDPHWQHEFLGLSVEERAAIANDYRRKSREHTKSKTEEIMDVNQQAVRNMLLQHGVSQMIHGHTHRPGYHECFINGEAAQRIVLGDWYEQGSVLRCDAKKCELEVLERH